MKGNRTVRLEEISCKLQETTDRVANTVAQHLTTDNRRIILGDVLDSLAPKGTGEEIAIAAIWSAAMMLLWQSMLAGGKMELGDYDVGHDFTSKVVEKYDVIDKDYRSLRRVRAGTISTRTVSPHFLANFSDDSTPLGGRCVETEYSSPSICRNIAEHCGDRRPLNMLRTTFVGTVDQVLAEGESTKQSKQFATMVRSLFDEVTERGQNQ